MVVLRIPHIVAGVFWVGAVLFLIVFVAPTAREVGPAAGPFIAHLVGRRRATDAILTAAAITIVAGALMYWRVSGGLDGDWLASETGIALTIGALSGIAAFVIGLTVVRPTGNATLALGRATGGRRRTDAGAIGADAAAPGSRQGDRPGPRPAAPDRARGDGRARYL